MLSVCNYHRLTMFSFLLIFQVKLLVVQALAFSPLIDRREWIQAAATTTTTTIATTTTTTTTRSNSRFVPFLPQKDDDDAILHIPGTATSPPLDIPRVGYSLYKTNVTQAALGVQLALQAGVKHFDVASMYGSNDNVGSVLRPYLSSGLEGVPDQPLTPRQRRRQLFVTLKVPPATTTKSMVVQETVATEMNKLGISYVDLVMIHSPLADSNSRIKSYEALLEVQRDGIAKGVGVCHYGLGPLSTFLYY